MLLEVLALGMVMEKQLKSCHVIDASWDPSSSSKDSKAVEKRSQALKHPQPAMSDAQLHESMERSNKEDRKENNIIILSLIDPSSSTHSAHSAHTQDCLDCPPSIP